MLIALVDKTFRAYRNLITSLSCMKEFWANCSICIASSPLYFFKAWIVKQMQHYYEKLLKVYKLKICTWTSGSSSDRFHTIKKKRVTMGIDQCSRTGLAFAIKQIKLNSLNNLIRVSWRLSLNLAATRKHPEYFNSSI